EVPLTLSRPSTTPIVVAYRDECRTSYVTFPPKATVRTVPMTTTGNAVANGDRTYTSSMSMYSGTARIPTSTSDVVVRDDDGPPNLTVGAIVRASEPASRVDSQYQSAACGVPESTAAALSANGRFVAFQSNAINLVPGDTNGNHDVFVKDLSTGAIERVSVSNS